jgi:hypothetical protein
MDPSDALRHIDQTDDKVRRSGRWAGRWFLIAGIFSVCYWGAMLLGPDLARTFAGLAVAVFTVGSFVYVFRQRVYTPLTWRLQWPVTMAFVGTTLLATVYGFVLPDEPGAGWVALTVLVAIVSGAPLIWGAWRLLRAKGAQG